VTPKFLSPADPATRWTGAHSGQAFFAYGTGKMLGWLVARGIDPHIPVWGKDKRDHGTFSREDLVYDKQRDVYATSPRGGLLRVGC
jgi:hypothetical protein